MASTIQQRYSRTQHPIKDGIENGVGQDFGLKKGVNCFLKPASPIESSRGTSQTSTAEKPETPATGTNLFSCSEIRLFHPQSIGGKRNVKKGEKLQTPLVRSKHLFLLRSTWHGIPAQSRQGGRRRDTQQCGYLRQHRQSVIRRSTGEPDWESTSSYEDLGGLA